MVCTSLQIQEFATSRPRTVRGVGTRVTLGSLVVWAAALFLTIAVLLSAAGPFLLTDPTAQKLSDSLVPPAWIAGGSWSHPLGTDLLGRDELSRVVSGGRASLVVCVSGLSLAALIGIGLGLIAGFAGGRIDDLIMRIVDVQLSIPSLLMALTVVTLLGPRIATVILVLVIYGWVIFARITRGQVLELRDREFVVALRALGASNTRIVLGHILPNALIPLLIIATLEFPNLIIIEAALGYLGLGIPPPTATWGSMISDGQQFITTGAWWLTAVPAFAIAGLILSINILGDWTRNRLDPRTAMRSAQQ